MVTCHVPTEASKHIHKLLDILRYVLIATDLTRPDVASLRYFRVMSFKVAAITDHVQPRFPCPFPNPSVGFTAKRNADPKTKTVSVQC